MLVGFIDQYIPDPKKNKLVKQKVTEYGITQFIHLIESSDQDLLDLGFTQFSLKRLRQSEIVSHEEIKDEVFEKPSVPIEGSTFLHKNKHGLDIFKYPEIKLTPYEEANATVIMVVGSTGSGKTTLLNYFINFILGVKFTDTFRYEIIVENTGKSQANSQTDKVGVYNISSYNGQRPIILVDTPGYGDTRGTE